MIIKFKDIDNQEVNVPAQQITCVIIPSVLKAGPGNPAVVMGVVNAKITQETAANIMIDLNKYYKNNYI